MNVEANKIVFIDESGNENLSCPTNSRYYVVLALIIPEDKHVELDNHIKGRRGKWLNGEELKSDSIGNDIVKRKHVLIDLMQKQFSLSCVVIDKSKLTSMGFQYSPSFVKYLHDRLYKGLAKDIPDLRIYADKLKRKGFTNEFKAYIEENNPNTLFSTFKVEFESSKLNNGIQAADFLCGTIRRCIEGQETDEDKRVVFSNIESRLYLDPFPFPTTNLVYKRTGDERTEYDLEIEKRATESAYRFVNENEDNSDMRIKQQVNCLKLLLRDYSLNYGDSWVATNSIKQHHEDLFVGEISEQSIRGIIAKLRDKKVLITSRRSGGYKIPTKESDLYEYLSKQNGIITPMLNRVRVAKDEIYRATNRQVDILERDEFKNLQVIINAMNQNQI